MPALGAHPKRRIQKGKIVQETTEQKAEQFRLNFNSKAAILLKGFAPLLTKFGVIIISYSILAFLFLSIYEMQGFERTIIILLVGVINYGIRR